MRVIVARLAETKESECVQDHFEKLVLSTGLHAAGLLVDLAQI